MAKFRLSMVLLVVAMVVVYTNASPLPQEEESSGGWKTWHALKEVFAPVKNYFTDTFPDQTPQDIADNVREIVSDAHEWAQENPVIQTVVGAVNQGWQSVKETANDLSEKSFSELYGDVKEG